MSASHCWRMTTSGDSIELWFVRIPQSKTFYLFSFFSLPLTSTRWFDQHIQAFLTLRSAVDKSRQHQKNSSEKFLGATWIKLGAAGCEAQMIPLCYAAPLNFFSFSHCQYCWGASSISCSLKKLSFFFSDFDWDRGSSHRSDQMDPRFCLKSEEF